MELKTIKMIFTLIGIMTEKRRSCKRAGICRVHMHSAYVVRILKILHKTSETTASAMHFVKKQTSSFAAHTIAVING